MEPRSSAYDSLAPVLALDVDGVLLDPNRAGKGRWQRVLADRCGVDPNLLDGFLKSDTAFYPAA
jgi:hypothetical protein